MSELSDEIMREALECYELYVALHKSKLRSPDIFTDNRCTMILTAIMGGHRWSWRVVGITPAALKKLAENKFKPFTKCGITRAHMKSRKSTCAEMMRSDPILSPEDFVKKWLDGDKTVLCDRGENRELFSADVIRIENPHGALFSSRQVGWSHSKAERKLLEDLFNSSDFTQWR